MSPLFVVEKEKTHSRNLKHALMREKKRQEKTEARWQEKKRKKKKLSETSPYVRPAFSQQSPHAAFALPFWLILPFAVLVFMCLYDDGQVTGQFNEALRGNGPKISENTASKLLFSSSFRVVATASIWGLFWGAGVWRWEKWVWNVFRLLLGACRHPRASCGRAGTIPNVLNGGKNVILFPRN